MCNFLLQMSQKYPPKADPTRTAQQKSKSAADNNIYLFVI